MHQLGMKVGLYMAGTMFPETLYHEIPEAKNWEQRDQDNKSVLTGSKPTGTTLAPTSRLTWSI